jgi:hypothetical protein
MLREIIYIGFAGVIGWVITTTGLGGASLALLWMIWRLLRTPGMPPVLPMALTFQWMQVTIGMFFAGLTGRLVPTMVISEYEPMVWIGLGCVASLALGLLVGIRVIGVPPGTVENKRRLNLAWKILLTLYVGMTLTEGSLQRFAWEVPGFTQGLLALGLARLGVIYLIMRRLVIPQIRWVPLLAILGFEIGVGATGYFAGFREPLFLATLVFIEAFDYRNARHYTALATLMIIAVMTGVIWMGVRDVYRADYGMDERLAASQSLRFERLGELTRSWFRSDQSEWVDDLEKTVDRLWAISYPALALARVPRVIPHTEGDILQSALIHIVTPRVLFPNKPQLPSDSDKVRHYSGVWVAGREENTSIAFGYAIESYVDFGVPRMFLPVFVLGLAWGLLYAYLLRTFHYVEVLVPLVTIVFWLGLYLFERSWDNMLGFGGNLVIYLGLLGFTLDRWLMNREHRNRTRDDTYAVPPWPPPPRNRSTRHGTVGP